MTVNQNVPTHVFGGGIVTAPNSFPSDSSGDVTYGGIVASYKLLGASYTVKTTDPLVYFITPTGADTIDLPAAAASMDGRVYQINVAPGGAGTTVTVTAGGAPISGGLATAVNKAGLITVVFDSGAVAGNVVKSA